MLLKQFSEVQVKNRKCTSLYMLFFPIHKIIIVNIFSTYIKKKLFVFGCAGSLLLHRGLLQLPRAGAVLCRSARASHWDGVSAASRALGCAGFGSCNMQAQELWHMGLVAPQHVGSPWTRDQTHDPALAGGLLTTGPLAKPPAHQTVL